jgi:hypothetical protein
MCPNVIANLNFMMTEQIKNALHVFTLVLLALTLYYVIRVITTQTYYIHRSPRHVLVKQDFFWTKLLSYAKVIHQVYR